jgi:hypothetical protein
MKTYRSSVQPKAMRSFWIDGEVDDSYAGETRAMKGTGPKGHDGRVKLDILMRDAGKALEALQIRGYQDQETGEFVLRVTGPDGANLLDYRTRA